MPNGACCGERVEVERRKDTEKGTGEFTCLSVQST